MVRIHSVLWLTVYVIVVTVTGCGGPAEAPKPSPEVPEDQAVPTPEPSVVEPAAEPEPVPEPVAEAREIEVIRDTWGVPHIFAETESDAAYAIGYTQAEDRLDSIYLNLRTGLGRLAEAIGKDGLETDVIIHVTRTPEACERIFANAPPGLKAISEAYIDGVEAYLADHPDRTSAFAIELEAWHTLTLGRLMQLRWAMGNVMDDLSNAPKEAPSFGSNEWTVAPSRSAENCAILMTDVHQEWVGASVFHEARVHGGDLNMSGMFIVGSPLMAFGHTDHVAWAPTTGGPDVGDVYIMKIDPESGMVPKYEYDGEWLTPEVKFVSIDVKGDEPFKLPVAWTKLGPILPTENAEDQIKEGYAYVGATPYFDDSNLFEQIYAMCKATNADELYEALRYDGLIPQNMMYADTNGTIGYLRNGRTPIRPEGYDWNKPVPGWTSDTAWQGLHPLEDFVQIVNPEQGYMQNVNISPENMMVDSPLTPDKYIDYIYNVSWDFDNPRSRRLVPLLHADDSMTVEEAKAIATDVYDILAEQWQKALREAVAAAGTTKMQDETFKAAVEGLLAWDGNFTPEQTATVLYKHWRLAAGKALDVAPIRTGEALDLPEQSVLLEKLEEEIRDLKTAHGKWDVAWGDVHKIGRGGQLFPVGGADFGGNTDSPNMTETLHDVRSEDDPDNPNQQIAYSGSHHTMLMFMRPEGIESYSINQWGNNEDPNSPHYMDQGERLYSKRELKPTWWDKEELMEHVESTTTLTRD